MRLLHTADWHVGKVLKGRSRADEHAAVLRELVDVARREDVDAVVVAGDVFDTAAPSPESQALVVRTLLAFREDGRDVVVLSGNHDNPRLLDVYRLALGTAGIRVVGTFRRPDEGGLVSFTARSGEPVRLAALPFLSHRYAVRASEALTGTPDEHNRAYAERVAALLDALTASFHADTVNLVATHGTLPGGRFGGGEREAQSIFSYYFEATAFPPSTQYAALGHLHRQQRLPGPCPIWYAGSPIAVDFGEEDNTPGALLVDVAPGVPATVRPVALTAARRLRTVRGTLAEIEALAAGEVHGDLHGNLRADVQGDVQGEDTGHAGGDGLAGAWLRVVLAEKPRAGLAEEVRELLPDALHIDIDERFRPTRNLRRDSEGGDGGGEGASAPRGPRELFRAYLTAAGHEDDRVGALFDRLHDEVTSPAEATGGS